MFIASAFSNDDTYRSGNWGETYILAFVSGYRQHFISEVVDEKVSTYTKGKLFNTATVSNWLVCQIFTYTFLMNENVL